MMFEKPGKDESNRPRRAGAHIGALVGGVLAAGAASGQEFQGTDGAYDTYTYEKGTYTDSYELIATPEALEAVESLNDSFGPELSVTLDKLALVDAMIDAYVAAHPPIEGAQDSEKGNAFTPSYSPLSDIQVAMNQLSDGMNPLVIGLLTQKLNQRQKSLFEKSK